MISVEPRDECPTCQFNLARHVGVLRIARAGQHRSLIGTEDLRAGDVVTCPECGTRAVVHELIEGDEVRISFEPESPELEEAR